LNQALKLTWLEAVQICWLLKKGLVGGKFSTYPKTGFEGASVGLAANTPL